MSKCFQNHSDLIVKSILNVKNNENSKKRCLKVSKGSSPVNNDVKDGAIEAKGPKSQNIELTRLVNMRKGRGARIS